MPLTLSRGLFSGSRRIQALSSPRGEWMRIDRLEIGATTAAAHLVSLDRVPAIEARMPLRELTRPYSAVDHELRGTTRDLVGFWLAAAEALREARTPIRVLLDETGVARRDPSLIELTGVTPAGSADIRVKLDWRSRTWIDHLWKHLLEAEGLHHFEHNVLRAARHELAEWRLPIEGRHLKRAWRCARIESPSEAPRALPPTWWPLLEIYAAVTCELLGAMENGRVVHGARSGSVRGPAAHDLSDDHDLRLQLNEEGLFVLLFDSTMVIARGGEHPDQPVYWSTTHPRDNEPRRLLEFARKLRVGFDSECVIWPDE